MRVLVLDAGPTSSYHVMRSLARAGHEVHLVSTERSIFFASKYCARAVNAPAPMDRTIYGDFLVDLVKRDKYDLLFFCGDDEAEIVWSRREDLAPHVRCFLPDPQWRDVAFSKIEATRFAEGVGVKVPRAVDAKALLREDATVAEPPFPYPVVIKAETGSSGRLVRYACDRGQLAARIVELNNLAGDSEAAKLRVQEYIPGPAFVVQAVFNHGEPFAVCAHRKERDLPIGRGVTSAGVTVHCPALDAAAFRILQGLGWHGLAKMDFKLDERDGCFKFIELDPRVSASIDITRVAGADQSLMLCDLAAGKPIVPQLSYKEGVRYRWLYPRDAIRLLIEPWRAPAWLLEQLRRNTHWDLDTGDPACTLRALRLLLWYVKDQFCSRAVWRQARELSEVARSAQAAVPRRPSAAGRISALGWRWAGAAVG
jgi:predicted ATP-grasp superfamily ATP-dependent carboligase